MNEPVSNKKKKFVKGLFWLGFICLLLYGGGRLYFRMTDGFRIAHISSDFAYDPRWETRLPSAEEQEAIDQILSKKFTYLGKGCQSYVFQSEDGNYVIKFLKYQRFRPQFYFYCLNLFPAGKNYLERKISKKTQKRENLFASWCTAFDNLPEETGLVYVHLNKTSHLDRQVKIIDKIGIEHTLNIDEMEFLIQKKASMLCPTLDKLAAEGKTQEAKRLLSDLICMVTSEYHRGLADNDHALMQNTGVYKGKPIHIDVGQFVKDDSMKDSSLYHQELYNKTWKFRNWLRENHPELLQHVDQELINEMGDQFYTFQFIPKER